MRCFFVLSCFLHVMVGAQRHTSPKPLVWRGAEKDDVQLAKIGSNQADSLITKLNKLELGLSLSSKVMDRINGYFSQSVRIQDPINPFNPEQIDIRADFFSNGKKERTCFGFYYKEFHKDLSANRWREDTTSFPFRIRFAPRDIGPYKVVISIQVSGNKPIQLEHAFNVLPSQNPGYLEVGEHGKHMRFSDSKKSFLGVGQVIPWPVWEDWEHLNKAIGPKPLEKMYASLDALDKAGGNYTRFVASTWFLQLEYEALGNYAPRLNHAWEFDRMIEFCEERDLYFMFCALLHTPLESRADDKANLLPGVRWEEYCYNDRYQHPSDLPHDPFIGISKAVEYYSNTTANNLAKRYFRYLVARYGYSTSLAGWQVISEVDETAEYRDKETENGVEDHSSNRLAVRNWTDLISRYMREELEDPHMNSIAIIKGKGYSKTFWDPELFNLKYIDFIGVHDYMYENETGQGKTRNRNLLLRFASVNEIGIGFQNGSISYPSYQRKPFIYDEFGHFLSIPRKLPEDEKDDPTTAFNNCADFLFKQDLWFTFTSGCAVAGLDWWSSDQPERYQMWEKYFPPLIKFASSIDFEIDNYTKVQQEKGTSAIIQRWPRTESVINRSNDKKYRANDLLEAYTQVSSDGKRAFGWMCNRSVNMYNLKDSLLCLKQLYEGTAPFSQPYLYKPKDADFEGKLINISERSSYIEIQHLVPKSKVLVVFYSTSNGEVYTQYVLKSNRKGTIKLFAPEMNPSIHPDLAYKIEVQ
jgi:hypothetical protein